MTNPITCRHRILYAGITRELTVYVKCVSCETDLTGVIETLNEYDYDVDHNLWVYGRRPLS